MTFVEVLDSGKRFRRAFMAPDTWYSINSAGEVVCTRRVINDDINSKELPSKEDMLSFDWEVEVSKVAITARDVYAAYERAINEKEYSGTLVYKINRYLGLE